MTLDEFLKIKKYKRPILIKDLVNDETYSLDKIPEYLMESEVYGTQLIPFGICVQVNGKIKEEQKNGIL